MPSDKFKFSAKSGVVAPVIKKLCSGKKKLLGKTSTQMKNVQKSKEVAQPKQIDKTQLTVVENSNIIEDSHAYENVCFSYNSSDEKSESFSEEVFAGVNLSLSSLNLDSESMCLDSASETSCQFISSACSTLTNYAETDTSTNSADINLTQKQTSEEKAIESQTKNDHPAEKLKSAIDNFDKILNEYTAPLKQPQLKPKLQKSKTCSIIESKCILKKTLSASATADASFKSLDLAQMSTKSLCHLNKDGDVAFSEFSVRDLTETQRFLSETDFWKVSDNKKADSNEEIKQKEGSKMIKVKDFVKKINSLSEDEDTKLSDLKKASLKQNAKTVTNGKTQKKVEPKEKPQQKPLASKPPLQKSLSNETKSILKPTKLKQIETKKEPTIMSTKVPPSKPFQSKFSQIPRAISCYDVSSKKSLTSKIPIKTNLNRTFPSTPGNLNNLDSSMRCAPIKYESKCQSVQNLAVKINLNEKKCGFGQKRLVNMDLERTVSCQNLSRSSANTNEGTRNEKIGLTRKSSGEPMRNLSKLFKGEEVLKAKVIVQNRQDGRKIASSDNCGVQKEVVSLKVDESKNDVRKRFDKPTNTATKPIKDLELENKKKVTRNLAYNKNPSDGKFSNQELVTDEERQVVKRFLEDLKKEEQLNNKTKKDPCCTGTEVKKTGTFGASKSSVEAKFIGDESPKKNSPYNGVSTIKKNILKRTDTYSKNQRIKEFQAIEMIEQNLKIAKEFLINTKYVSCDIFDSNTYSKANCVLNVANSLQLKNISSPDVRKDDKIHRNIPKITINDISLNGTKDYLSDENSDDSGNISNELELEYEDVPIGRRSILDKANKNDQVFHSKRENKIFFRSGVLTQLESQRDEKLAGMVISLQAHCRGYLARRRLCQRKLQDLAVRCIQRNVRKFLLVRDWPWWRLLVRVTPLLNVHRTEEELKLKTEELELLKAKLEKLETERTSLKHQNDKLEAKLSEMTADLAEEHSTSTLAAERLDAETADRIRLERELGEVQQKNKALHNASERLEMELLYARSELNGISEDDEDADGEAVYKQRYERAMRELEFTKRRLQQQHEDDLEQLVGLKKQLEKKLTDAYEEVEEQRQVVGQWKRKVQKLNGEMNDLKLLLEEQSGRNNLLEKKQRKFDSELQLLHDELKKEKQAKDRLSREKEVLTAEKFTLESNSADLRLELDLKDEKVNSLQKDLDELTYGGKTEEEVTLLRKQKIDCERRLHDQEEELDELAGQVQLLEQAKLKLEMNLEQQRKSGKKEAQQHDEELEEVRCNAQKKVKALEAQLENEHEERTILLREKHELERRLTTALENDRSEKACDEAVLQRLKRDLKRTKALLRDTQAQLERQKAENPSKALIRQLKNQIEDLECARSAAVKTKQILEAELSETQAQLEETARQKNESEERANTINREKADLQLQVEENEEELAEVLKKYKITIQQMSLDQLALQEQVSLVGELEAERNSLKEQLVELTSKLDSLENAGDATSNVLVKRTELKVKELESKLDLEQTTRGRLEVQISRLKETMEKLQNDLVNSRTKEQAAQDQIRKLQRSLRELRDEHNNTLTKESESLLKRKELEKRYEALEAESSTVRTDLRLALKRIEDLQAVIQNDLEDSTENSDSEHDSYSSDDSVNTFLANHKISNKSNSMQFDSQRKLTSVSRSSTSNNIAKDSSSYA